MISLTIAVVDILSQYAWSACTKFDGSFYYLLLEIPNWIPSRHVNINNLNPIENAYDTKKNIHLDTFELR